MADFYDEPEGAWDEYDWERFLQQQDSKTERYMELFEKYIDDPNRDQIIAQEMGWTHLLDWPHFVMSQYDTVPSQSISVPLGISRLMGSGVLTAILSLLLFGGGIVVLWRRRGQLSDVGTAISLGLILTMLASPHLLAYDSLFLAVPLAWMARRNWARAVALTLALSPAYLLDSFIAPAAARAGSVGTSLLEPLLLVGIAVAVVGEVQSRFPRMEGTLDVRGIAMRQSAQLVELRGERARHTPEHAATTHTVGHGVVSGARAQPGDRASRLVHQD